jgi:hypothetical protein
MISEGGFRIAEGKNGYFISQNNIELIPFNPSEIRNPHSEISNTNIGLL